MEPHLGTACGHLSMFLAALLVILVSMGARGAALDRGTFAEASLPGSNSSSTLQPLFRRIPSTRNRQIFASLRTGRSNNEGSFSQKPRKFPRRRRVLQEPAADEQCTSPATVPSPSLTWQPLENKFLLMLCFRNQISNLMRCMRNHVILAGLLNRTLLIPDWIPFSDRNSFWPPPWQSPNNPNHKIFDLRVLWDFEHANKCLGEGRVMRLAEFAKREKRKVVVDVIHCWYGHENFCGFGSEAEPNCPAYAQGSGQPLKPEPMFFEARLPQVNLSAMKKHTVASAACLPRNADASTLIAEYTHKNRHVEAARVLVVGELVNMIFTDPAKKLFGDNPFGHDPFTRVQSDQCSNRLLLQPAQELFDHAQEVIQDMFGDYPFVALHWRRGDFLWYCTWTRVIGRCTYAAPQAATCVSETLRKLNISRVYLATNAAHREVIAFKRYLAHILGMNVRVYSASVLQESAPWLLPLAQRGVNVTQQKSLLSVTLDKVICAFSVVFLGSVESTFTMDIQRMRVGLGRDSTCDTYLCHKREEWDSTKIFRETMKTHLAHS